MMKKTSLLMLLATLMGFSAASQALDQSQAEDLADLTAVYIYLKNDCGYGDLPNAEVKRTLAFFAQQNRWDLSNYGSFDMAGLTDSSYKDLSGIAIAKPVKCKSLSRDSLNLLAYANK